MNAVPSIHSGTLRISVRQQLPFSLRSHLPDPFALRSHLPDLLDLSYTHWYLFTGVDTAVHVQISLANHKSACNIQRAFRAHRQRQNEARMLSFAMGLQRRLGAASPVAHLDGDVLAVIKRML